MSSKELLASVVIPTFNGQEYLSDLLDAVFSQKVRFKYEVIIIDSGSTDDTLQIISKFRKVRLIEIPNEEFGHGKTRNKGIREAKGEFVVFLTQDAVPATDSWLEGMIEPFSLSDQIGAVLGKQVPRPGCCAIVKKEVSDVFASFGPDQTIALNRAHSNYRDQATKDAITFYSDVNSAMRKSIFPEISYRDVEYAEDQAFGIDVINAGYMKAYAPMGAVLHSHDYPLFKYFRRKYDESKGLHEATGQYAPVSLKEFLIGTPRATINEIIFIIRDRDYRFLAKLKWIVLSGFYNFALRLARWLAGRKLPSAISKSLSLEKSARKTKQ